MNIFVLLAHPRPDSFCHAIAKTVLQALEKCERKVLFHDLYKQNFDPILQPNEAYTAGDTIEQVLARSTDPVIDRHRREIGESDGLIVIHPNWWGKPPAILSGWLDRVLVPGVAYRLDTAEGEPEGLLSIQHAIIFNTSDTPKVREQEMLGDPLQSIWGNCVLPYCGVEKMVRHVFRPVAGSEAVTRENWLKQTETTVFEKFG